MISERAAPCGMFTRHPAPLAEDFDAVYGDIKAAAAMEIYHCNSAPAGVEVSSKDVAQRIQKVFAVYANDTVNVLFTLGSPNSSEDSVSYKASRVNMLLLKENYGCFHLTDDDGVGDNI